MMRAVRRYLFVTVCAFLSLSCVSFAGENGAEVVASPKKPRRGVNVSVSSSEIGGSPMDRKFNSQKNPSGFPQGDNTSFGLSEDGDPNLGMRF